MKALLVALMFFFLTAGLVIHTAAKTPGHACAADAIEQARPLLLFHSDNDQRAGVSKSVSVLPAVANPVNQKQKLDVLEVIGHIYRANYRMRFIYARSNATGCILVGQEILELTKF
jgi:hypothetical protein